MSKKYFGTDGIRGRVGEHPVTPEMVLKLGWAVGKVFADKQFKKVLIGKDTRISGYLLESVLEAGLTAAGADVRLLGPMPTPGIAYLTRTFHAQAGIVISASHNPYYDNGIKFFSSEGKKLADDVELAIEEYLQKDIEMVAPDKLGKAKRVMDAPGRYIEYCKSTFPMSQDLSYLKIVLDCANGATYHIAPKVLAELKADVVVINDKPDGLNINENCGSTAPEVLGEQVLDHKADLGIALDGDGDRLIMVDHTGRVIDGDEILYIIASNYQQREKLHGGVVGTLMSNLGLEVALKKLDIPFARSKVGDRYVLSELQANNWLLGGESSGHILCLDKSTTGDGIVSALQVLAALNDKNCSLHDAVQGMSKYPQTMINVPVSKGTDVINHPKVIAAIADAEQQLQSRGRVLLRPSGTEPLVRVMVEGEDAGETQRVAEQLVDIVRELVT